MIVTHLHSAQSVFILTYLSQKVLAVLLLVLVVLLLLVKVVVMVVVVVAGIFHDSHSSTLSQALLQFHPLHSFQTQQRCTSQCYQQI